MNTIINFINEYWTAISTLLIIGGLYFLIKTIIEIFTDERWD